MKNTFSLKLKFIIGFGAIVLIFSALLGYLIYADTVLNSNAAEEDRISQVSAEASLLDIDVLRNILFLRQYADSPDPALLTEIQQSQSLALAQIKDLRSLTRLPAVTADLDNYEQTLPERAAVTARIIAAIDAHAANQELIDLRLKKTTLDNNARSYLRAILDAEKQSLANSMQHGGTLRKNVERNTEIAFSLLLIILILTAMWIIWAVRAPIVLLTAGAKQIAGGNLDAKVSINTRDEFGQLAASFNDMALKLKESYQSLASSNQQLKASNQQLRASNQQLDASSQQLRAANQQLVAVEQGLKEKVAELEIFNKTTVGRELKMIELKKEIEELKNKKV